MSFEDKLVDTLGVDAKIKRARINGYEINYLEAGSGQPLIMLHGLNIGWGQWYKNIADLSKSFRVYALDMPGSGGSTKFNFAACDMERDLVETIEGFIVGLGPGSFSVIGHSVGGWVALRLALRGNISISKIVLSNPLGLVDHVPIRHMPITIPFLAKFLSRTVMKASKKSMKSFLASVCHDPSSVSEVFSNYYYESVHRGKLSHPFMAMNRLFRPFALQREFVLTPDLKNINNQVLVITGSHDFLVPHRKVQQAMNLLKNGRIVLIAETGHVPFIERPREWNNIVQDFLLNT
ncbi:MAG: alpha/beta hydrolase [Candidatus Vogelbacteria bacterium]|nr:alpha/beta hydrolase [Candidatus Vogelbacteria bacterium]